MGAPSKEMMMRYRVAIALSLVVGSVGAFVLRAEDQPKPQDQPKESALDTTEKKVGYGIGHDIGSKLRSQGAGDIDVDSFVRGLHDGLAGTASVISESTLRAALKDFQAKAEANATKMHEEESKKNKAAGIEFLEKNKSAEGVKVTASGLQYKVVKAGSGEHPKATDTVTVNYEGTLLDGTVFDSSYQRGEPATFPLNRVIKGWTEGLQLMDVGSTYMLYIPSELAYGSSPPPGAKIGADSVLIFKVELIAIGKK
jgi:FKBP-type peptidyl-prolyl cis-trans isomerase